MCKVRIIAFLWCISLLWMGCKKNRFLDPDSTPPSELSQSMRSLRPDSPFQGLEGSREPSGAVALPSKGGLLVVDDEPKRSPQGLGVFFYTLRQGRLQHRPLFQIPKQHRAWDDWEGITRDATHVVLMTSHSKARRKRSQFCRFPLHALRVTSHHVALNALLECRGGKRQRTRIQKILMQASAQHGWKLDPSWLRLGAKQGGLDMEALAWRPQQNVFWIGLRAPLARQDGRHWAIVLEMRWGTHQLHFRYAGLLHLGGRGIRGWHITQNDQLLLSAGPVGSHGSFKLFGLKQLPQQTHFKIKHLEALHPQIWPSYRPQVEGLTIWGRDLILVRDTGHWKRSIPAQAFLLPLKKWIPWISLP